MAWLRRVSPLSGTPSGKSPQKCGWSRSRWSHFQPMWICPADAFFACFHSFPFYCYCKNAWKHFFLCRKFGLQEIHYLQRFHFSSSPSSLKIKLTRACTLITFTPSANALAHHRGCTLRCFFRCWRQCIRYCWLLSISQSVPDAVSSTSESSFFTSVSAGATNQRFQFSRGIH